MHLSKRLSVHVMIALCIIGLVLYDAFPAHAVVSQHGKPTPTSIATPTSLPTSTATPTPAASPTPVTTPIPTPSCTASWHVVSAPTVGTGINQLNAVSGDLASDVWAVGQVNTSSNPALAEHWNGSSWSLTPTPDPGGVLHGVAAISPSDVWAVGTAGSGPALIEHWNGTAWSVVPSPNATSGDNQLLSVAAVSSNNVWAVGNSINPNVLGVTDQTTLIEHWNGSSWSIVSSPNVANEGSELTGIAVASANDIWVVGYSVVNSIQFTLTEHWNGSNWAIVASPNTGAEDNLLNGVAVASSNDVWAVGMGDSPDYGSGSIPITLHWNGASWSITGALSPSGGGGDSFSAAAALGTNDVWAVGSTLGASLTEQWDGTSWHVVSSPTPPTGADLVSVSAAGVTDIWAVGGGPLTEHFTC